MSILSEHRLAHPLSHVTVWLHLRRLLHEEEESDSRPWSDLYISSLLNKARFSACTLCGKTLAAKKRIRDSPLKNSSLPLTIMFSVLKSS